MPATPAATTQKKAGAPPKLAQTSQEDPDKPVRLHITPLTPALLKAYLAPSVQPLAKNISYHTLETFPEKGFGYIELPAMEAQKLKKKLNGSTLKGSKVRIEEAKPEKRKAGDDAEADAEEEERRAAKRAKKSKKSKKEQGVLEGAELPDDRKVKRGWTEVPVKGKKERYEKKDKKEGKDKDKKLKRKESKYTKEPELLFKAKLTPVAAAEVARKEKKDKKKDKKSKSKEVVVHEFEKNTKTPSFLKAAKVSTEKKPAVDYVNGKGWVDEDGNVVEAETGKARNRRLLELVDPAPEQSVKQSSPATPISTPDAKKERKKAKNATPPPESESEESSVVSSSSEDEDSDDSSPASEDANATPSPKASAAAPSISITPSAPTPTQEKEVHPFEALFKKHSATSTPAKSLAPINTSFSFFGEADGDVEMDGTAGDAADATGPVTPYTQRDLEWRGLRSAAPTPDTAAVGRRFSFPWRNGSQDPNDENEDEDDDAEVDQQLTSNTKANATSAHLPGLAEEAGKDEDEDEQPDDEDKPESEFRKWFWENQGNLGRAWKKRRREAVKAKRSTENRRAVGGRRAA